MRIAIVTLAVSLAVLSTSSCVVSSCHDGIRNGDESDIDCGGSCVAACGDGDHCFADSDCASGVCGSDSRCATVVVISCSDGIRNGDESDVDCGGSCGATCDLGFNCGADADCKSGTICGVDSRCSPDITTLPNEAGITPYVIDPGVGLVVNPGTQAGFGITANTGASYRIVWTGDSNASGTYHEFTGTVWTDGMFTNFVPGCNSAFCPLEANDFVSAVTPVSPSGQVITFDTFATDGLDGFDFVSTSEPVYFDLRIDGAYVETLVFFSSGGAASNPAMIPFALQSN